MNAAALLRGLPDAFLDRPQLAPLKYAAGLDRARTRGAYGASLKRAMLLSARADQLLDAATAAGVELLPLKGMLLADALYGDAALRPMADLDLAVRPAQLARAVAVAEQLGFTRTQGASARFSPRHAHDVALAAPDGTYVEIHYRLFHELGVDGDVERLFAQAIDVELRGHRRRAPSWDDQLALVAIHASTHALGEMVLWVFDIALLVERCGGIAAAAVEAQRRGGGVAFWAALEAARALLGPERVPELPSPRGGAARAALLAALLGRDWWRRPPHQVASLLARAVLTERPLTALGEVRRKAAMRVEMLLRG